MACAWAGAELLADGTAAVPAGQRAWPGPSAPPAHISSPAKSPMVPGRARATVLGLPHKLEKGLLMLLPSVVARGSAVSWGCLNERNFKEFGSVCFSAQRMQALSALPGGNANNPYILLWENLFWTNLLHRFGVLEAVVLFLIISVSAAPQKTLPQPGHHLPSNTESKAAPSPRRWWSQCVLEAKGGREGAKVRCSEALAHRHPSV